MAHRSEIRVENALDRVAELIEEEERRRGDDVPEGERIRRFEELFRQAISDLDREVVRALPHPEDIEDHREHLMRRIVTGDSRLAVLRAVAEAAAAEDGDARQEKRAAAIKMITRLLDISKHEAAAFFDYAAAHPDVYWQVVEIEHALAVLQIQPDRFGEFAGLVQRGDRAGVDRLFSEIAVKNKDFSRRVAALKEHREHAVQGLMLSRRPELKIDALLGNAPNLRSLQPEQKLALAEALQTIDRPVRDSLGSLPFQITANGLEAPWLGSRLTMRFRADQGHPVFMDGVPVEGGTGRDFFRAAVISQVRRRTGDSLDLSSWRRLAAIIDGLGPNYGPPNSQQTADAVRIAKLLQLDDGAVLQRLGIADAGNKIDEARCRLIGQQVSAIVDTIGVDEEWLNPTVMAAITRRWDDERRAKRRPVVLTVEQIKRLSDSGDAA